MSDVPDMAADLEQNTGTDTPIEELERFLRNIISSDDDILKTLQSEAIQEDELIEEAKSVLNEAAFDFESKLQELKSAEQARDNVVNAGDQFWNVFVVFFFLTVLGLIVLLVIGIGKWTGHLLRWPLWPFVVAPIVLAIVAIILAFIADHLETSALDTSQESMLPVEQASHPWLGRLGGFRQARIGMPLCILRGAAAQRLAWLAVAALESLNCFVHFAKIRHMESLPRKVE